MVMSVQSVYTANSFFHFYHRIRKKIYVILDHKTSLKCRQKYIGSKWSIYLLCQKIIRIISKDHVPWRRYYIFSFNLKLYLLTFALENLYFNTLDREKVQGKSLGCIKSRGDTYATGSHRRGMKEPRVADPWPRCRPGVGPLCPAHKLVRQTRLLFFFFFFFYIHIITYMCLSYRVTNN